MGKEEGGIKMQYIHFKPGPADVLTALKSGGSYSHPVE